jgi:hypothetical protein
MCGWLKDRYGVSWQIVPTVLGEMMKDSDRDRARRVTRTMLQMKKFDIARLEEAYAKPTAPRTDRHHAGENIPA